MFTFLPLDEDYGNELIRMKDEGNYSCFDLEHHMTDLDHLLNSDEFDFFVGLDDDQQMVGFIECVFDENKILEVGCGILPDFMGQGYGFDFISECVEYLVKFYDYDQPYVLSYIRPSDTKTIKVMERIGFKITDEAEDWVELSLDI